MYNDLKELLIIDDDCGHNIITALVLKKLFHLSDVNFTFFTSSQEGLAYILQSVVSTQRTLLFLDINMPGLNGWQVLEQLEQLPGSVKKYLDVYILTASPNEYDKTKGFEDFTCKTISR